MIQLSVVILTCDQLPVLRRCLDALTELYRRGNAEIIVVDNGSADGTCECLTTEYPYIRVIANTENRGVAPARNQGLRAASGDKILILDNDTIPNTVAIDAMSRWLDTHPSTGIVACRLTDPQGAVQDSFKPYPGLTVKISNLLGRKRAVRLPESPVSPEYVIGACQMFRRSLTDRIGLLDERIFYGPEDADFCLRARSAGLDVVYLPEVSMIHDWRRATTRRIFTPLARKHISALLYFYHKHHRWL